MGDSLTVKYSRRVATKDRSGDYDTVDIGGEYTFDVKEQEDPFELYQIAYNKLAEKIESDLLEYAGSRPEPKQEVANYSAGDAADGAVADEPAPAARGWVEQQIATNTKMIHDGINARAEAKATTLPGEKLSGGGGGTIDEYGTPSVDSIVENEAVMFQHCRVFEVNAAKASNGNPFVKVRIGKRGENGIPGQYTNARSFDAQVIKQVAYFDPEDGWQYKIRDGDFVDVWGYFKPWKNNPEKFDLELQKIQVSEDG